MRLCLIACDCQDSNADEARRCVHTLTARWMMPSARACCRVCSTHATNAKLAHRLSSLPMILEHTSALRSFTLTFLAMRCCHARTIPFCLLSCMRMILMQTAVLCLRVRTCSCQAQSKPCSRARQFRFETTLETASRATSSRPSQSDRSFRAYIIPRCISAHTHTHTHMNCLRLDASPSFRRITRLSPSEMRVMRLVPVKLFTVLA